jgi:putative glutamine amidotransferase
MKKPIIGVIPDYKTESENGYSKTPFYAIRENYLKIISHNNATAIILPYDYNSIDNYLNLAHGLLFIGGGFDVNPKRYNEEIHPKVTLNEARDNFEFEVLSKAIEQKPNLPIFGICNGSQLINIFFGGNCIQHIPDYPQYMNHEQSKNPEFMVAGKPYHDVIIEENTKLFEIAGEKHIKTNSSHHQAVKNLGENIIISAKASDGIVEALEHSKHPFCLGVQWHPEFLTSKIDNKLFNAFIKASLNYTKSHF